MGKKEEITDLFTGSVSFYTDKSEDGKYLMHKGKLLKFDYEGSEIAIVITKIDRKNRRVWGEHTELGDERATMSHYGHNVSLLDNSPFCTDCEVPMTEFSTEDGEVKARNRADRTLSDGTEIPE